MRISHYDAGTELTYDVTGFGDAEPAKVKLVVDKFVGGGFAGQVYRVKITEIDGDLEGIEVGGTYATKILIPPSNFSRLFRNLLYWIGFQGPFQQQVNPAAARAGSLWQKFIRRAAKIRFGDENTVVDVYGTFVDAGQGSCGELREWVEGRTWLLEVDDRLDLLKQWRRGRTTEGQEIGSPEYRAKYEFMRDFVKLLHDMGAYEFARQYEWSTCKSQPNALKRAGYEDDPAGGLTAVDFRAGLALLPFLPMSPGDFKLIAKGLARGSLVQFDRGSIAKLEAFMEARADEFADMGEMLRELKTAEAVYRDSLPDVTHNHVKLLYSGKLWSTMLDSAVTGWRVRNLVDEHHEWKFRNSKSRTLLFFVVGLVPFLGKIFRRMWGREDWRRHYGAMLGSPDYFRRSIRARMAEKVTVWYRAGRVDDKRALRVAASTLSFMGHLPLSILPAGLHRFLTDWAFFKNKFVYLFIRPIRLYFSRHLREQWLQEMVQEGKSKHILSDDDADAIVSHLNEPYVQRYLISLVVHLLTLPVTQIVSGIHVFVWNMIHPEATPTDRTAVSLAILALYQIIPISPGSFCRGLYTTILAIHDRNFKDYNIALFLSYFKYVGYLAFPIQMTYHYPALARFMAAHWSTEAVHIVPVFGERGALLEHWVYCLFYNRPLTIRRRMRRRAEARALMKPRYWHAGLCIFGTAAIFGLADYVYFGSFDKLPSLRDIWWLVVLAPLACGAATTLGCGGAALGKRIAAAAVCGVSTGILYTAVSAMSGYNSSIVASCLWRMFIFAILSAVGAILTEIKLPENHMVGQKNVEK
jgi:hypothetical protein